MRYTVEKPPLACMLTTNPCYRSTYRMQVRGVLWHSTGADNPTLRRYVQPTAQDPDRAALLDRLGVNRYGNDWGHTTRQVGVNAFVGKLADGSVAAVQTMPWDYAPWGCGSGKKGSCNDGWIQFEMCEDDLVDPAYFQAVYREAVELTAYLCGLYGLDPLGTVEYNGVTVPVILCHQDSYQLGLGNNHGDVYTWFKRYGKTMDDVRADVAALLAGEKEEDEMDLNGFKELWREMRTELQDNDSSDYSEAAREWAVANGIVQGGGGSNYMWEDVMTREQMVTILFRFARMIGKA